MHLGRRAVDRTRVADRRVIPKLGFNLAFQVNNVGGLCCYWLNHHSYSFGYKVTPRGWSLVSRNIIRCHWWTSTFLFLKCSTPNIISDAKRQGPSGPELLFF